MTDRQQPPARERVATLRQYLREQRGEALPRTELASLDTFNPCTGYYYLAESYLIKAIAAKDDETFALYLELADSAEQYAQGCEDVIDTLP